MLMRLKQFQCI